ncbi:MAG TPA: SGNH/GDSL hydrolase family protein [Polyangiaceae bacterium]|jgi:lysophospholipase L1-like esterase
MPSRILLAVMLTFGANAALRCGSSQPNGERRNPALASVPAASPEAAASRNTAAPPHTAERPTTPAEPARRRYALLALGDSLTDERVHGGGYLKYMAGRCPESRIDNFAKGGTMVNQMRRQFEAVSPPAGGYTHLLIFGGVNDLYSDLTAGRTVKKITQDLSSIYKRAHQQGMQVIAITVAPWGGFARFYNPQRAKATLELNRWIKDQQTSGAVDVVIDAHALLSCGDPERLCPDYEQRKNDGLHFNRAGHERLGQMLYQSVFQDCR